MLFISRSPPCYDDPSHAGRQKVWHRSSIRSRPELIQVGGPYTTGYAFGSLVLISAFVHFCSS